MDLRNCKGFEKKIISGEEFSKVSGSEEKLAEGGAPKKMNYIVYESLGGNGGGAKDLSGKIVREKSLETVVNVVVSPQSGKDNNATYNKNHVEKLMESEERLAYRNDRKKCQKGSAGKKRENSFEIMRIIPKVMLDLNTRKSSEGTLTKNSSKIENNTYHSGRVSNKKVSTNAAVTTTTNTNTNINVDTSDLEKNLVKREDVNWMHSLIVKRNFENTSPIQSPLNHVKVISANGNESTTLMTQ
jgi:hypothetical protein